MIVTGVLSGYLFTQVGKENFIVIASIKPIHRLFTRHISSDWSEKPRNWQPNKRTIVLRFNRAYDSLAMPCITICMQLLSVIRSGNHFIYSYSGVQMFITTAACCSWGLPMNGLAALLHY
jgi:hypothetical protein